MLGTLALRSTVLRKGIAFARQVPRGLNRAQASAHDYAVAPPALANSVPKSGTHLLLQILQGLPQTRYYGSFVAWASSIRMVERNEGEVVRRIHRISPGEALAGHLNFRHAYAETLRQLNCAHFFIYRDPRDVVVSEAHYLTYMARFHRLHPFFARALKTDEERLTFAIIGDRNGQLPVPWGSIADRYRPYLGWLSRDDVCAIRYEDLIGERRDQELERIIDFYANRRLVHMNREEVLAQVKSLINPSRSHTFRNGGSGAWRKVMTPTQMALLEKVSGDLLEELGYE